MYNIFYKTKKKQRGSYSTICILFSCVDMNVLLVLYIELRWFAFYLEKLANQRADFILFARS